MVLETAFKDLDKVIPNSSVKSEEQVTNLSFQTFQERQSALGAPQFVEVQRGWLSDAVAKHGQSVVEQELTKFITELLQSQVAKECLLRLAALLFLFVCF